MSFYLGCYLILSDEIAPPHDSDSWELPDTTAHSGHMSDTSNVEELLINPEDMDLIPTQIQFGCAEWTDDEGWIPDDPFAEFYVKDENFYVRDFIPRFRYWTEFYPGFDSFSEFYAPVLIPTLWTEFYPGADLFTEFYPPSSSGWVEFYVKDEAFYVRNFTWTDQWSEFYPPSC
jgi:hypothetical protein